MMLNGDDISRLYTAHASDLLRFFARRTLQADVAVDLVAETFAEAFAVRGRFRGHDDRDALAWLFGIARNELAEYFRRGQVEQRAIRRLGLDIGALADEDYERVEELASLECARTLLIEALAALSAGQRRALELRIVDERSYLEIAKTLGISEQSARTRVSRALRTLAKATASTEGTPGYA